MKRRIVVTACVSILGGLLAAVFLADRELLALRVWASASLVCFTLIVVAGLMECIASEPRPMRPLWQRQAERDEAGRAAVLRATDRQVSTAIDQARSFDLRLRPRIAHLVEQANIDPAELGSAAWLLDESISDRAPSIAELDEALTALEHRP